MTKFRLYSDNLIIFKSAVYKKYIKSSIISKNNLQNMVK